MSELPDVLEAERIQRWFAPHGLFAGSKRGKWIKAVDGVDLTLGQGEVLGLIGESGCGKSTIGRVLVGLDRLTGGTIRFAGQLALELLRKDPKAYRRKAQIVFQNPFDTFDPRHTVASILGEPLRIHRIGASDDERRQICLEGLTRASLVPATDYIERYPHELSGGQLQRVSILRAMLLKPIFLVADEPVSMLDVSVRAEILNDLIALASERRTAMLFISHDISVTRYVADRIAVMYLGRIVESGVTDDVLHSPAHPYAQALISSFPSTDPLDQREWIQITGEPPTPLDPGPGCYFAPRCPAVMPACRETYPEAALVSPGHWAACHRCAH